jgi:hypothetical protein
MLPPEAGAVLGHLTDAGRRHFIEDIVGALVTAQEGDDLRPVNDVIQAWYRTMQVRQSPGYEDAVKRSSQAPINCGLTVEDVRARLALG